MLGALFGFRGRLSRPGFWEVLMSILLIDIALVIGRMYVADGGPPGGFGPSSQLSQADLGAAPWVLSVFTVWSLLAAAIKRCHDRNRTGALILVGLIPVIGWLWLLIDLFVLEGTEGRNRYGKAPHAPNAPEPARHAWDAPAAEPAEPAYAAAHAMLDPEPAFEPHAPMTEVHEPPVAHAPEPHAEVQAAHAEPVVAHEPEPEPEPVEAAPAADLHAEEVHAAHEPDPPAEVHEVVETHAPHEPEPARDHGRAAPSEDPYDPLTAPLVLHTR